MDDGREATAATVVVAVAPKHLITKNQMERNNSDDHWLLLYIRVRNNKLAEEKIARNISQTDRQADYVCVVCSVFTRVSEVVLAFRLIT